MSKKRILVVEDEDNMRLLITEELEESGYEVDEARNGQEALEKFRSKDYDLVTVDIEMPGMNGLEVAGKIREMKKDAKIIILTAYSHYKSDLASWAADAYVVKSSDLTELKDTIAKIINM
ncbi:chemotaxis protein CheY [Thermosipho melanesiensis]|uniref:Response regulator receiver protein n=2 Tax=Thermosipho melanesiensis TaxID=46541 RepID=A6LK76_THEM4|nr:response regulator [Thermosipho melanesiensis]ABR30327.1 response regulator receiver protein [Thermosipho melanesiensis BI429]APT73493.1 chemotaxis protein CheY [Thermosipho melanesiensis]OOC37581.1 chemotaxis protein CheY [Thermosipho melanesiensis]OOC39815.1 chemotaxis protein CheY [Thermosipho melanesiensis]OOC39920.1 chemotaxis protein CheY [Thermosipho melanesiensis]